MERGAARGTRTAGAHQMKLKAQAPDQMPFGTKLNISLAMAIVLTLYGLIYIIATRLMDTHGPHVIDFDVFRVAGMLAMKGRMAIAYVPEHMYAAEAAAGFGTSQMPWAYPPQMDLVTPVFILLPRILSYVLYMSCGLTGVLFLLRKVSGADVTTILIASWPALMLAVLVGQTACLMAILAALFALGVLRDRRGRGVALGLMVIKPHLAIGFGMFALIRRDWRALGEAVVTVVVTGLMATAVFGVGIWPAFLHGAHASATLLKDGQFLFFRLMSTFASLRMFGVPADLALAAQAGVALLACGLLLLASRRAVPLRDQLGLAALCTLLISPYSYDYDMPTYAVAMALLWPTLRARSGPVGRALIVLCGWVATGWSSVFLMRYEPEQDIKAAVDSGHIFLFPGLLLVALTVAIAALLLRQQQDASAGVLQPA